MASSLNWLSKSRLGQARKESISLVQLFEHAGWWLFTVEQKIRSFEGPHLSNLTFFLILILSLTFFVIFHITRDFCNYSLRCVENWALFFHECNLEFWCCLWKWKSTVTKCGSTVEFHNCLKTLDLSHHVLMTSCVIKHRVLLNRT